jgi:hypothetical protein
MLYTNPQENFLIVGTSGSGKHLFAAQRLMNSLADGNTALVFDGSRSYRHLARMLGGTIVTVGYTRAIAVERFGTTPLTVFELDHPKEPVDIAKLPHLSDITATTFVLVDDMWHVTRVLPGLLDWLQKGEELNAGFCGVMQLISDVALSELPTGTKVQRVENFARVETETLVPGQLVRHQDGGIYRYHSTARHTDDQRELVVYEHVWPFATGQVWARPANEWPSRFTPISNDDLRQAQKLPRADAQAAITNAKALRRAEEARRKARMDSDYNNLAFAAPGSGMSAVGPVSKTHK